MRVKNTYLTTFLIFVVTLIIFNAIGFVLNWIFWDMPNEITVFVPLFSLLGISFLTLLIEVIFKPLKQSKYSIIIAHCLWAIILISLYYRSIYGADFSWGIFQNDFHLWSLIYSVINRSILVVSFQKSLILIFITIQGLLTYLVYRYFTDNVLKEN
ncbi:MAG: hypothetical protein COA58_13480 [Bacteroidetes bacterium]|nr:MAG: hypothetical protein COA58_13480 [Bacteroidota bacterium]